METQKIYCVLIGDVQRPSGGNYGAFESSQVLNYILFTDKYEAVCYLGDYVTSENEKIIAEGLNSDESLYTFYKENYYRKYYSLWDNEEYQYAKVAEYDLSKS